MFVQVYITLLNSNLTTRPLCATKIYCYNAHFMGWEIESPNRLDRPNSAKSRFFTKKSNHLVATRSELITERLFIMSQLDN